MNFGENLQNLRKISHISQEELAEKLNVSRQAISKWESNDCYPETEKLLKICELFNCSMDTLLKGKIGNSNSSSKKEYDDIISRFSKGVSIGLFLILIGVTILLSVIGIIPNESLKEKYIITGVVITLIFTLFALPIFILRGIEMNDYKRKNPTLENFYTNEEIDKYNTKFSKAVALSVSLILLGVIMFMILYVLKAFNESIMLQIAIMMIFITFAVPILAYFGIQKDKYDIEKYNKVNKVYTESEELLGKISAVIMILATIVYFILGFIWNLWKYNWLVFPICGMICGIFAVILQKEK